MLRKLLLLFLVQICVLSSFAKEPNARIIVNELSLVPGNRFVEFLVIEGGDLRGVQFDEGNFAGGDQFSFPDVNDPNSAVTVNANGASQGGRFRFKADHLDFQCVNPGVLILVYDPTNTVTPALDEDRYDDCRMTIPLNSDKLEFISAADVVLFDTAPVDDPDWVDATATSWDADLEMLEEGGCFNIWHPNRITNAFENYCWGYAGAGLTITYSFLDTLWADNGFNNDPSPNPAMRLDSMKGHFYINNDVNVVAQFMDSLIVSPTFQFTYSEVGVPTPGNYNTPDNETLIQDNFALGCGEPWENITVEVHDNNASGDEILCYGDNWTPYFDFISHVNGGPFHFADTLHYSIHDQVGKVGHGDTTLEVTSLASVPGEPKVLRYRMDSLFDPSNGNQPYMLKIDSLIDRNGCTAIFDPAMFASSSVRDTLRYTFLEGPGPNTECEGEVTQINIQFAYDGPTGIAPTDYEITFEIQANGVSKGEITTNSLNYTFATADTGVFSITQLGDQFCPNMNVDPTETIHLVYNDPIVVSAFDEKCDGGNNTYVLTFEITGGQGPYTVNGNYGGTVNNAVDPAVFLSGQIPDGADYQFVVSDAIGCPGGNVNVIGQKVCQPCDSKAGAMDQTLIVKCESDFITVNAQTGQFLDGDDRSWYVMHDGGGIGLGSIFQIIEDPSLGPFSFQATMQYGETYYISNVVGNPDGFDNPDQSDPCLAVSQGTPIVFYEKPSAAISGPTKVCVNDPFVIPINFLGSTALGDVEVTLKDQFDGNTFTFVGAPGTTVNQTLTFQDAGTHKVFIESVSYQNGTTSCGTTTGLQDTVEFRVYDEPQVTLLSAGSNVVDFCNPSLAIFNVSVVNPEGDLVKIKIREIVSIGGTTTVDTTFREFTLPQGTFTINAAQEFGSIALPNSYTDPSTAVYEIVDVYLLKPGAPQCSGTFDGSIEFQRFRNPIAQIDLKFDNGAYLKDSTVCEGTTGIEIFFTVQGNGPFELQFSDENGSPYPSVAVDSTSITDPYHDGLFYGKYVLPAVTNSHTYHIVSVQDATVENPCVITPADSSVTLTVNELPRIDFRQDQTICSGDSAVLRFVVINSNVPFGQLDVDFRGNNTADPKFAADPLDFYTASGFAPEFTFKVKPNGDVRYGIVRISDSRIPQCSNETSEALSDSVQVQVKDLPENLVFRAEKGEICLGESDNLLFEFNGDGPFSVDVKNLTNGSVTTYNGLADQDQVSVSPTDTTGYQVIRVTDGSPLACIDTTSMLGDTINVNPLPTVVMSGPLTHVCEGDDIPLSFSVTGTGTISVVFRDNLGNQYIENFNGPQTATVIVPNPGVTGDITFSILAVEDGINKRCTNTSPDEITVRIVKESSVVLSLVEDPLTTTAFHTQICEGNTTELQFNIAGEGTVEVFYTIKASVGSVEYNKVLSRTPGTYTESSGVLDPAGSPWLVYVDSVRNTLGVAQCKGTDQSLNPTFQIAVSPEPTAVFTTGSVVEICEGGGIQLDVNLTGVGNFQIDVEEIDQEGNLLDTKTYINLAAGPVILPAENPTDTTIYRIVQVRDGSEVTCINNTQSQVKVNVLPKPSANFVPNALNNTKYIDTICSGGSVNLPLSLVGVGNITTYFQENISGVGQNLFTYTGGSGLHTLTRNLPTVTSITQVDYRITKVEDGTSPTCPEGNSSNAFATIYIMPTPTATISFQAGSPSQVCEGEDVGMRVRFTGKAPCVLTYKDDLGNEYVFVEPNSTTTATERFYNINFTPLVGTTRIDPLTVVGGSTKKCVGNVSGSLIMTVNPKPEADWNVLSDVYCEGSTKTLTLNLRGNGPFDVVYEDPSQVPSLIFLEDVDSGDVVTVNPPDAPMISITYTIKSVVDNSNPQCFTDDERFATLSLVADREVTITDPIVCDDTAATYTVELNITGGDPATYMVDGNSVTSPFTSTEFTSGDPYAFVVSDESGCPDTVLVGDHSCPCVTAIGDMTSTSEFGKVISVCGHQTVDFDDNSIFGALAVYNDIAQVLDPNDTLIFVISGSEFDPLSDVKEQRASTVDNKIEPFQFSDLTNVNYGDTVYIAAVVGNKVDLLSGNYTNDACLGVSESFAIVWFQSSIAQFGVMDNPICTGDTVRLVMEVRDTEGNLIDYPSLIEDFDFQYNKNSASINEDILKQDVPNNPFTSILDTLFETTTYTITMFSDENNNLCSSVHPTANAITVAVLELPDVTFFGSDTTICAGDEVTFVPNDPTAGNLDFDWDFSVGNSTDGQPQFTFPEDGMFDVTLKITDNATGCVDSLVKVDYIDVQAIPNVGFDGLPAGVICAETIFTLTDTTTFPAGVFGGREWYLDGILVGTDVSQEFNIPDGGVYEIILQDTSTNGCKNTMELNVNISGPSAEIIFDKNPVCVGEQFTTTIANQSANLASMVVTGEDGNVFNGDNFPHTVVDYPADGTYRITAVLTDDNGCTKTITNEMLVLDPDPSFSINGDELSANACLGSTALFQYEGGSISGLQLSWDFNGDGQTDTTNVDAFNEFVGNVVDTLTVRLTVQEQHCSNSSTVQLIVRPLPDVEIETSIPCIGKPLTVRASGADEYEFEPIGYFTSQNGNLATTVPVQNDTSIVVIGTELTYGCVSRDTFDISVIDLLQPIFTGTDQNIIIGEVVNMDVTQTDGNLDPDGRYVYEWTPDTGIVGCNDCPITDFRPLFTEEYTIRMYDTLGCYDQSFSFNIFVDRSTSIDLPDAFTPNMDGINDLVYPFGWGTDKLLEFSIYNRWGEKVFTTDDAQIPWDGKYKGDDQPVGSYVYVVRVKTLIEGEILETRGTLQLMR